MKLLWLGVFCYIYATFAVAAPSDWTILTDHLSGGIEDRQSVFNEFFNDEAPYHRQTAFPIDDASFMFIAQGNHLLTDRINRMDDTWQDRHQHPHNQWNDLKLEGRPNGKWRYFINMGLTEPALGLDEAYATFPIVNRLQFKIGQFYSGFGRLNSQHPHDRDFIDTPLIYQRLFGDTALLEKGVQLSVLPSKTWMLGVEQLSATNRDQFNNDSAKPALSTVFSRWGEHWGNGLHSLLGASVARGQVMGDIGQQAAQWQGIDFTLKQWLANDDYWQIQGEILQRSSDATSTPTDEHRGHYVMALYRWLPQWRAGIRHEHAQVNTDALPNSTRHAILFEHDPNTWLRTRWQLGYETQTRGVEGFYAMMGWQATFQWLP